MSSVEALLRSAVGAVAELSGASALEVQDKGGDDRHAVDLVTEADLLVDDLVTSGLARLFPGVPVVSEERPLPEVAGRGDCFVLDPIDGTHNFASGLPFWGISLARVEGAEVQEAWILDGVQRQLYSAQRGGRALRDGRPLAVSDKPPELSLISLGLSRKIVPLLLHADRFCGMRMLGSHSLGLALAASGEVGIHAGSGHPWDVAAGYLLLECAGGKVVDFEGRPRPLWETRYALAGAPRVVDLALEILLAESSG